MIGNIWTKEYSAKPNAVKTNTTQNNRIFLIMPFHREDPSLLDVTRSDEPLDGELPLDALRVRRLAEELAPQLLLVDLLRDPPLRPRLSEPRDVRCVGCLGSETWENVCFCKFGACWVRNICIRLLGFRIFLKMVNILASKY